MQNIFEIVHVSFKVDAFKELTDEMNDVVSLLCMVLCTQV